MEYPKITLAAARVNAGLTQKEAAQKLKISLKTLVNYESGANTPNWETVQRIGKLYNFPTDYIFFGSTLRLKRDSLA